MQSDYYHHWFCGSKLVCRSLVAAALPESVCHGLIVGDRVLNGNRLILVLALVGKCPDPIPVFGDAVLKELIDALQV